MNLIWLAVQGTVHAAEGAAEEAPNVFNLSMSTSFWTLIIFFTLLFVLWKWAYPPILGYAQAREDRIQQNLDEAKEARDEAQAALEAQRRDLAKAREEAQQIIAQGKQDAEKVRQELVSRAKADQEEVIARARREIEREREQAVESLRREAVELSIAAAAHLLGQRIDAEEDRRIVTAYLDRAQASGAPKGAGVA